MRTDLIPWTFSTVAAVLFAAPLRGQDQEDKGEAHEHSAWFADYDKALAKAKAEKKDLLVDFTGSTWSRWSRKLDEEVFAHETFLEPAQKQLVLCALDFPRSPENKGKFPNLERDQKLQAKFGVQGFPTILLISADEDVLGRTGYRPGGPESYMEHLDELLTKGRKLQKLCDAFEKAEDTTPILAQAAARLVEMDAETPGVSKLANIVKKAFDLDAEEHGELRKRAALGLLKSGQGDEDTQKLAAKMDPKNERGMLEIAIRAQFLQVRSLDDVHAALEAAEPLLGLGIRDTEVGSFLFVNSAMWCRDILGDNEKAKPFAKKALEFGVDQPQIKWQLEQVVGG